MIRHLTLLVVIFVAPLNALALYDPTGLADLAGTSELIVIGVIVQVDEGTVEVKVDDLVAGASRVGETITVKKFGDWACARRWEEYAVGQKLLMFLDKDRASSSPQYLIRGAGDEGESLIVDEYAHPRFHVPGLEVIDERPRVRLDVLRSAVADFRATFRITRSARGQQENGDRLIFDRIEPVSSFVTGLTSPKAGFQDRYPPRTKPKPVLIEFERRSAIHRGLAQIVKEEQLKIEKAQAKSAKR